MFIGIGRQMDLTEFGVDLLDPNIDIEDFFDWRTKKALSDQCQFPDSEAVHNRMPKWRIKYFQSQKNFEKLVLWIEVLLWFEVIQN